MNDIFYGIPTYKRADAQITLAFLKSIGIDKSHIIMSTQIPEDYNKCKELYSDDCVVIYRPANNLSGNRNTIIDHLPVGTNVLILDDDISGFEMNKRGTLVPITGKAFIELVDRMFFLTRKYGGKLWSVYPVRNAYFMEDTPVIKFNKAIIAVHGVITSDLRYDERQTVKEDYLFVCENLKRGYPTLRIENITSCAKHWTNDGGCKDQWHTNDECYKRLFKEYPQYINANTKRPGEVLLKQNIKVGPVVHGIKKVRLY